MPVENQSGIPFAERPEISVRVLADRIASCEDPIRRKLIVADFLSKLKDLPANSYYWSAANILTGELSEKLRNMLEVKKMRTTGVLIITVRDDEIESLKNLFPGDCTTEDAVESRELTYDTKETCYRGRIKTTQNIVEVLIAQNNETGQEDSAANTTNYIGRFAEITGEKLNYAALVGICAGSRRRESIDFGDIVVPPHIFDRSVYKLVREKGKEKRVEEIRFPGKPNNHLLRLCKGVRQNKDWCNATLLSPAEGHKFPPDVHLDPVFTENAFLEDPEYLQKCRDLYNRKAIAYEMEAGGFATACDKKGVPFIVVRGISDWADENASDETWRSYASRTATAFLYEILKIAHITGGP